MLKYRVITAIILLPIFLLLLFYLSAKGFASFTAGVLLWAGWEWTGLMGLTRLSTRFLYLLTLIAIGIAVLYAPAYFLLVSVFAWWCVATILVFIYPRASSFWANNAFGGILVRALMGYFVLIPCWIALNIIRNLPNGINTVLFLFILIWSADMGAYFVGKKFGKTKLAPRVSPGKTVEGVLGGILCSLVVTCILLSLTPMPRSIWPAALLLVSVTVVFSIMGDLFESMIKRNAGVKDSGRLLPGHGGLLDRIDSLTAAAPVFLFFSFYMARHMGMG